jgi:hypothetical protein
MSTTKYGGMGKNCHEKVSPPLPGEGKNKVVS